MGGFTCRSSSLQKYNELYIVASCWTINDIKSLSLIFAAHKSLLFLSWVQQSEERVFILMYLASIATGTWNVCII
jgi:hypothetical protein